MIRNKIGRGVNAVSMFLPGELPELFESLVLPIPSSAIKEKLMIRFHENRKAVSEVDQLLVGSEDDQRTMLAILAGIVRQRMLSSEISVEPVCTISNRMKLGIKSTKPEILRLIGGAKRSVYILGYWLTHNAREVIDELGRAKQRGVDIIILGHDIKNFFFPLVEGWNSQIEYPSMYVYTKDIESEPHLKDVKMHAKTMIIDDDKMLITSANLTHYAFSENLEIGILIGDRKSVHPIAMLINNLIHNSEDFREIQAEEIRKWRKNADS